MGMVIAIDVGGTQMRAALYPEEGIKPLRLIRIPTQDKKTSSLDRLINLIQDVWPNTGEMPVISIAVPGVSNPITGMLYKAPNIPGWVNLPIKDILQSQFNVPVQLGNDANLAAMAEWKYGAARGHDHVIYITVSTGIGGGVITSGKLLLGQEGLAAELGHITIQPDGPLCGCGLRGHLEAFASGPAIARYVESEIQAGVDSSLKGIHPLTARDVGLAAGQGDLLAIKAFSRTGSYIGLALASFLHIFNPSIIVFGGGVSRVGDLLFKPIYESLQKNILSPQYLDNFSIVAAQLGDDTGLLGALAAARHS